MPVFEHPWLLLITLLALLPLTPLQRARHAAIAYPLTPGFAIPRTRRQKLLWIPDTLRALVLALLGLSAAGPHWGAVRTTDETRGIAIELLVDRSSSMALADMSDQLSPGAPAISRLQAVKRIAKEFLNGNGFDLKGRSGDAVGLIAFRPIP